MHQKNKIKDGIKIKVTSEYEFNKIQEICFDNDIGWRVTGKKILQFKYGTNIPKWIIIRNKLYYSEAEAIYNISLVEVNADLFIKTNGTCVEDTNNSPYWSHKKLIELLIKPSYKVNIEYPIEESEYLIFVEGKSKPSKIHTSLDEAEKEARRLCEKEMKEVHILKSIKKFKPIITIEEI